MSDLADLHALTGAYAVDALDDLERARFERHLDHCPDCAAEVCEFRETAAVMTAAAATDLPPGLRERVLAEVATVRPLPPEAPVAGAARRTARRFPQLVAAAVAAFALIGGGIAVHPWSQPEPAPVAVSTRVMDAPDSRTQSITLADGGKATLYHAASVGRAVVVTHEMTAAPSDKAYELWFKQPDGNYVPAGLIPAGGNETVVLHGRLGQAEGVGITIEPASGSKQPTTAPIAMFDLSKSV